MQCIAKPLNNRILIDQRRINILPFRNECYFSFLFKTTSCFFTQHMNDQIVFICQLK